MKKIAILLLASLLSGCGARAASDSVPAASPSATPSVSPSPVPSASPLPSGVLSTSPEGLQAIQDRLTERWEELQERHSLAMQFIYSTDEAVVMEVRPYDDYERKPSDEEIEAFKSSLFELAGEEFPVEITVRPCCESEPQVTGKIKAVENNRVLIVHETKKNGNTDDPEAYWVSLTPDGKWLDGDAEQSNELDESLVGREAKAWTTGMVQQSYPSQTSAIKIVVE